MALTNPTFDVNNVQSLADQPTENAAVLKATFDKASADIKTYLTSLVGELDGTDGANVKLTTDQTVAGVKTFTSSPVVPTPTTDMQASTKKYVNDENLKDVHLTGDQSVSGIKTFALSPIVPTPTTDLQASTKKYADDVGTSQAGLLNTHKTSSDHDGRYYTETEVDAFAVKVTGNQSVAGVKTFSSSPIVPIATTNTQAVQKVYVDNLGDTKANVADVYTKVNMQTTGQSLLHWDNLTNIPAFADNNWKAPVANLTALNALTGMEDGDLRLVLDTDVVYTYDSGTSVWKEIGASGSGISDHGTLIGLGDDDHTQYLRTDGTRPLTGNQSFGGNQATNIVIEKLATAPTPSEGRLWYDTSNHQLKIYNGSGWVNTTGIGAVIQEVEITATSGQAIFDISLGGTQSYNTGDNTMSVMKKNNDGLYEILDRDDYVETNATTITLNTGVITGTQMYFKWQKNIASILDSIADGSLADVKLSDTAGQIKDRVATNTLKVSYPGSASATELNILEGATVTTAELNKLEGFTGAYTDLNYAKDLKATGVTATEFDYLDGVTSAIQTQLGTKATTAEYTVTIPSTSWTGTEAPYTKTVTVTGILSTDKPIVDIVNTGTYATDVTLAENWGLVYRITTASNSITVYANEVPSASIPIQLKVVR